MGKAEPHMFRRVAPLVGLVLGALIFSLLIGEAVLRAFSYQPHRLQLNPNFWITGWAAMDEELGWVNREGIFRSVEAGQAPMSFAADGRRSDPVGRKSPALPKILVVGCSFTQGEAVPDDEPYPHLINRALPNFEVLNFGTGGYGTYQSLLRIQSYFRSSPPPTPLVIYGFNGHHMTRNLAPAEWVSLLTTRDGRYLIPPHVRLVDGRLREFKAEPVELWPLETHSAAVALAHKTAMRRMRRVKYGEYTGVFTQLIRQMKGTVSRNSAALLVLDQVGVPDYAIEIMRQEGIDYVNCEPPTPLSPDLMVGGLGHPNGRLHALWAKCLLRALADRGYAVAAAELTKTHN